MQRKSIIAWAIGAVAFIYVLIAFSSIWPMASVDVGKPKGKYIDLARQVLTQQGIDHQGYEPFVRLAVRTSVLDQLQQEHSIEKAANLAEEPNGLVYYYIRFKKSGTPKSLTVWLHPDGGLIGFSQYEDPDIPEGGYSENEFRQLAKNLLNDEFQIELNELEEVKFDSETKDGVIHYRLDAKRPFHQSEALNEIFAVMTGGKQITAFARRVELTKKAQLERKRLQGPERALGQIGMLCMGLGLLAAYVVFLFQLREGKIELLPALKLGIVMFGMLLISAILDSNTRHDAWDPVWPNITMWVKMISQQCLFALWALVLGWALLAGGTQAPGGGPEKTTSFWKYAALKWNRPEIALASIRGGAIGFVCGAVVILLVKGFESLLGGEVGLQPRSLYLTILDRQLPALAIVLFFFPIAVVEEAGYRLFAAMWIRKLTKSTVLAIVIPAIIFGIVHTSVGFLPPEKPWWGRAVLMLVIGLIWGWAFFRFDFLTVVLCHFMADVVIFSWPLLVSDHLPSRVMAGLGISVALWPAIIWLGYRLIKGPNSRVRKAYYLDG